MRNDWQSGPRVTVDEADQVVELWLQRRLAEADTPAAPRAYTIPEVAQALGASEDEVVAMVAQIRTKNRPAKLKPAMPLGTSWRLIIGLYVLVGLCAVLIYGARHRTVVYSAPYPVTGSTYPVAYASSPTGAFAPTGTADRASGLPRGFGFSYRGNYIAAAPGRSDASLDWAKAGKLLVDQIVRINGDMATTYEPLVNPEEIARAIESGNRTQTDPTPGSPDEIRLIGWNELSLDVNGHRLTTMIPSPLVANESVEAAARKEIERRVSGMLKSIQNRLAEPKAGAPGATDQF